MISLGGSENCRNSRRRTYLRDWGGVLGGGRRCGLLSLLLAERQSTEKALHWLASVALRQKFGLNIPGSLGRRGPVSRGSGSRLSRSGRSLLSSLGNGLGVLSGDDRDLGRSSGLLSRRLFLGVLVVLLLHFLGNRGLILHLLGGRGLTLFLLVATKEAKDGGALLAGRALAVILLGLQGSVLGLLLGLFLGLFGGGNSGLTLSCRRLFDSLGGLGLLLLVLSLLFLLLFLLDVRERGEGGLVCLRLGDGLGNLLGLGDLRLQLLDPVVAFGLAGGLEGVLVALGREDKLVGTLGGRLGGIMLQSR